eukprot:TRINITY_DN2596_c0_g2_i3.p1 TRINITY_DN2596_c0_g2~~TRINITY_DN2596_c0_g2_i3.p1  ORF type:complete len:101 (-),score=30.24 TRINITY_DN2596_c0_g2_i3:363-665(-)
MFRAMLVLAAALALVGPNFCDAAESEFLAASNAAPMQEEKSAKTAEASANAEKDVEVVAAKEIELSAATNPYMHTGPTAEALALLFMMVSCMICYLECCK